MDTKYKDLISFHGHNCPGLAMGYRMTKTALDFLSDSRAEDEEIVAITENNACGVDALQFLSGCTFGKGNLIFKDYGKNAFTLFDRKSQKAVRVVFNTRNVPKNISKDKDKFINWILTAKQGEVVSLQEVKIDEPEPARIMKSVECEFCGESVMETRTREIQGKLSCIPCARKQQIPEQER